MSTISNQPSTPPPQQEATNLQISDLQNLLMIIDVASQRGAFKGPELSQVGMVFDRVNKFLQSVLPASDNTSQVGQPVPPQPNFEAPPAGAPVSSSSVPPFFNGGNG